MRNRENYILGRIQWFVIGIGFFAASMSVFVLTGEGGIRRRVFALILLGAFLVFLYYGYQKIYQPLKINNRIKASFARGDSYEDIYNMAYPISAEEKSMFERFSLLLDKNRLIALSKKTSEYLALQNQINPHFLYNTLEGIRAEAVISGVDTIAEMTEALATYFRYTISQVDNLVTLEEELANVENYYYIQKFRFGDRLDLMIRYDCEDEYSVLQCQIPKLTLQPIVENSIYHGLEQKMEKGHLDIKITATDQHLIIMVSDDGVGMEKEQVKKMNEVLRSLRLEEMQTESSRGGIAVRNVNNRIKLLFGEEYGISIYSQSGAGTDVEITLPPNYDGGSYASEKVGGCNAEKQENIHFKP